MTPTESAAPDVRTPQVPRSVPEIAASLREELERLEREASEIEMLAVQARTEAELHETRRLKGQERAAGLEREARPDAAQLADAQAQLLTLSRRAILMQAQVQVLEGKQRTLQRFRERLGTVADELAIIDPQATPLGGRPEAARPTNGTNGANGASGSTAGEPPRGVRAQEEMRRDIARQMHDGPAQSLANIALQAEIVQRLLARDPGQAAEEVEQLRQMVQRALDATKTFIFDVRPMVLDDLGLVPTLRRAAADRGKRAGVAISFESTGADRRMAPEIESGFFRIVDDALVGYLSLSPSRLDVRMEWSEAEVRVTVQSGRPEERASLTRATAEVRGAALTPTADLPPALAEMIHQQKVDELEARTVAHALPMDRWADIRSRAADLGVTVRLLSEGQVLEAIAATSV